MKTLKKTEKLTLKKTVKNFQGIKIRKSCLMTLLIIENSVIDYGLINEKKANHLKKYILYLKHGSQILCITFWTYKNEENLT